MTHTAGAAQVQQRRKSLFPANKNMSFISANNEFRVFKFNTLTGG